MDMVTMLMFFGGMLAILLWQDMRHAEKRQADRARIAELIDSRNDFIDDNSDLEDEVNALKEEVRELEEAEHDIELDFSLEDDDDDLY